jgi:hypothetical protein
MKSTDSDHRVYSSPEQTFVVNVFDSDPKGPLNTAQISVFPGARPLMDREAEHVWLALLSQKVFIGQKLPFHDPGLGMAEPSTMLEVSSLAGDVSPRKMRWVNEYSGTKPGRPEGDFHWETPRIEGEFCWETNCIQFQGAQIPAISREEIYLNDPNGKRRMASSSELLVESVATSDVEPERVPKIPGRNVVYDYRMNDFSQFGWSGHPKYYNVQDGKGLEKVPTDRAR